jgi:predicted transposase YdaD
VWQLPPAALLEGGLGVLPLAPISAVTEAELPGIIKRMEARLHARRVRRYADDIWSATFILLGLRYSRELARQLLRGVQSMKESVTYQWILEEGMAEGKAKGMAEGMAKGRHEGELSEARKFFLQLGEDKFGPPDAHVTAAVEAITDVAQLEALGKQLRRADNWEDLFGPPTRRPRPQRRPKT